jgi:hypothetical protein
MLVALTVRELNLDEFKSGLLHEKLAVAKVRNHLSVFLDRDENQVNLCPDGTDWLVIVM